MTKPITILHARVVTGAGGGPDKTILRSAAHLDRDRYHAVAAYLHPAGDTGIETLRGTAARFGMDMHTIPERGPLDPRSARLMLDLCKRMHVDVWHSHDYKTDILGRLLCRQHPMKLVTTMHGFTGETWRTRLYARLSNPALRGYDRVLAVSPQLMRYAAEHGVHPDKLRHIPNAIDLSDHRRALTRAHAKAERGIDAGEHAIGVVARFSVEKGVDRAIRLFVDVHKARPCSRLHLIGDGPQRRELEALAVQLGVSDAIRWWGWQTKPVEVAEAMDTLLLTSHTEGLPNAVLEAMAIGLPVAATRVGALPGVLAHGEAGVLLSDEPGDWLAQVLPLIDRPLYRERLLCNARVRVEAEHDFAKRMQRVASVYEEITQREPMSTPARHAPAHIQKQAA
ncbi:MAG: glycosyltransferase [Phycisphaeraceae bacterium]